MAKIESLAVFCGSSPGRGEAYVELADHVGRTLAERGVRLVYGGGSVGLMGRCADACLAAGGEVIGVITEDLQNLEVGHTGCTQLDVVQTMSERKQRMAELSDGFVSLPGGVGTLDEMFEMITWTQLDIHTKPNALLNIGGYYDPLIEFLERMVGDRFFLQDHYDLIIQSTTIEGVLEQMDAYIPRAVEKWVDRQVSGEG